jgi:hypothetical protein
VVEEESVRVSTYAYAETKSFRLCFLFLNAASNESEKRKRLKGMEMYEKYYILFLRKPGSLTPGIDRI